ncbi:arginyl-tRNA synthetase [Tamlana nanhaiensis]|uniref:Arginyl-tRNA synthetase n=2 Tax=Neotamlana nanhaiensis TaxID=1382798 RepID=A0A0D7W5B7_9FLAO|nr:arginyl-tRNA synthetase [Tamlana nanhaiensis]
MVLDTTHYNKEHKFIINELVGRPYTLFEAFRIKGIGSSRMIIDEVSNNFKKYLNKVSNINYANIEIRKEGILVYINKGLKNYTWAIPYYQLVIYKTDATSIHAQGNFIRFNMNKMLKENKQFFKKILNEKIKYSKQFSF